MCAEGNSIIARSFDLLQSNNNDDGTPLNVTSV